MANRQRPKVPSAREAERRWIAGQVRALQREVGHLLRVQLGETAAAQVQRAAATGRPMPGRESALDVITNQIDHLHFDLVAIRAHLDIPNPGCASAEEHTEP